MLLFPERHHRGVLDPMTEAVISEATQSTFDQLVIERSHRIPVLVDFWADWCAPCRTLGPLLEETVKAHDGQIALVKVNADAEPVLAARYGVRALPTVKLFIDGKLENEFVGAQNRPTVEHFVASAVPSDEERALQAADEALQQGRPEQVEHLLRAVTESPHYAETARLLLARAAARLGQAEQAMAELDAIAEDGLLARQAGAMRTLVGLSIAARDQTVESARKRCEAQPDDLDARWVLAGCLLEAGDDEATLEQLLEIVKRDRKYRDDGARLAMLAIFEQLPDGAELVQQYRRQLQIYT
jgi:putative thioredoxin